MQDETALLEDVRRPLEGADDRTAKLRRVASILREGGGYRWVGIYEISGGEIALGAWSGPGAPTTTRFPASRGLCGDAVTRRRTIVVGDVGKDPRYFETFADTRSEIVVPILNMVTGVALAVIDVESDRPDAFRDADRRAIEHVASEIAAALSPSPG